MLKKIVLAAFFLLPLGVFAQDKIACVSTQDVYNAMPETAAAEAECLSITNPSLVNCNGGKMNTIKKWLISSNNPTRWFKALK